MSRHRSTPAPTIIAVVGGLLAIQTTDAAPAERTLDHDTAALAALLIRMGALDAKRPLTNAFSRQGAADRVQR